ncbi:MAG: 2-oxoglutarate dehydrogenase E1 subunit family protein, partial [Gemmobacter sp.]
MTDQSPTPTNVTFLDGANADYIDQLQARHAADPASVDAEWADYFRAIGEADADAQRAAGGGLGGRAHRAP